MLGQISKINIISFNNQKGEKKEFATFTFFNTKCGFLDCKCFKQPFIDNLKTLFDKDEITILSWFPRKEKWVGKDGKMNYITFLIVDSFEITKHNSQVEQQNDVFNEFDDSEWEKEFN